MAKKKPTITVYSVTHGADSYERCQRGDFSTQAISLNFELDIRFGNLQAAIDLREICASYVRQEETKRRSERAKRAAETRRKNRESRKVRVVG